MFYHFKPFVFSSLFFFTVVFMTGLAIFYLYQLIQYKEKLHTEIQKQANTAIALSQAQQQLLKMKSLLESEIASQTEELAVQAEALSHKNHLLEQEIEQRIHIEQTLRRSEKRFYTILDHLPAYVYLQDENYQLHYANQYFYQTFEVQKDTKSCYEALLHQATACPDCPALNVLSELQPQHWECEAQNGHTYAVQAYPYTDIDGTLLVLEMGVDVTETKKTQQDLKISQERFNLALQGTSGGVWDWNLETNEAYFSKRWKAMLGYTPNEISNDINEWHKRIHPRDKDFVLELIQYYLTKNYATYENTYRLQHKQGHYIWVLDRGFAIWDQNKAPNRFTGMHVDISHQKTTEHVLRQKEEFLRSLLDSVPQYICWKDADSIFQGCNQSFAELVGLSNPKEVIGKTDFDLISKEKATWFRQIDAQIIAENKPRYHIEEVVHLENKTLWFETSKIPLHDENNNVNGLLIAINDVSERKKAEELLKKYNDKLEQKVAERTQELEHKNELLQISQHRFTTVLDSLSSAVYVADMETFEILFVNLKAQEFFGDNLVGNTCWKAFYDSQDGACSFCSNSKLVAGDTPTGLLTCEYYNDKVERWFFLQEQAIYWDNGKVVRLSVATDITERKQAEAMLQESQSRLLETQRIAHIGHWEWNLQSQQVFCSEEVARQFGYSYEAQLVPIEIFSQAIHPEDQERVQAKIKQALQNREYYTTEFRVQSDQHLVYLQTIAEVISNNNGIPTHILGSSQDITERKLAEVKLKLAYEELAQFKSTLDKTLDSILMNDVDTMRFTYVNEGAKKLLGYSEQELLQLTPFDISDEFTPTKMDVMLEPLIQHKIPALKFESSLTNNAKQVIPVEVFIQYFEVSEQDRRFIAVVRDITERKKAEAQLQQAIHTAREAQAESEKANQAKTMFLANMSHELRTPLNGILGYAQLLERDKNLSDKQLQSLSIIQRSGEHLLTLINDILDLSKIEAGKLELHPTEFRLAEFLLDIVDLFSIRAKQKGIDFTYEQLTQHSQSFPVEVYMDEKRLRQILLNLLSNAIKFTDKGKVSLKYIYRKQRLRFEVQDTGLGINQQYLNSIFEPFRQIDNLHTKNQEGTGLGLPITQRLVYMMDGELHVETELNKGSLFWFEIPLSKARYVDNRSMAPTQQSQHNIIGYRLVNANSQYKLKILIADDIKENGLLLESLLEPLGFELQQAYDGQQAIEKATVYEPHIIIMDMKMPVMDGLETTRALRQLPQFANTIIIAFSASVLEQQQQDMLSAGCNDFLSKPIRSDDLFNCLAKTCPLEWVYDSYQIDTKTHVEPKQIILPPKHELEILFKLSVSGKVQAIQSRLESLQKRYVESKAFIDEIQTLLDSFELKKLKEVLKQYLS
ncbi:PAS domain S-box protein [Candidatus Albibeggiatoa sp. nov. NOAA]|uniref:PAS domain S-box protein n=1 Tax=Candidatus Albibeggiatoa sp. nov. NOAA TaxID=3162724 RepID=UPI0032F4C2AA|nr:PAS domain S-box protein [Thiotrichaceae bacterium]